MTTEELQQIQTMIDKAINAHSHTGTHKSGPRISGRNLLKAPQTAISDATSGAGGSYTAAEQAMLDNHAAKINAIFDLLENLGLMND